MKEINILRNALFDELSRLKRGTANPEDTVNIVKVSNAILKSYEVEIKAVNTILDAADRGIESRQVSFIDNETDLIPSRFKADDEND